MIKWEACFTVNELQRIVFLHRRSEKQVQNKSVIQRVLFSVLHWLKSCTKLSIKNGWRHSNLSNRNLRKVKLKTFLKQRNLFLIKSIFLNNLSQKQIRLSHRHNKHRNFRKIRLFKIYHHNNRLKYCQSKLHLNLRNL